MKNVSVEIPDLSSVISTLRFEDIDIYDSERYYKDVFSAVIEDIVGYRDQKYNPVELNEGKGSPFFCICGEDYWRFDNFIQSEQGVIKSAVEIAFKALKKRNGIKMFSPKVYKDQRGLSLPYFSYVYVNDKNEKIGVKLVWNLNELRGLNSLWNTIEEYNLKDEADRIEIVVFESEYKRKSPGNSSYYYKLDEPSLTQIERCNKLSNERDGIVSFFALDFYFVRMFGDYEYRCFKKAVDWFNAQNKEIVGYKTSFMPNELEVARFRSEQLSKLKEFDYKSELKDAIEQLRKKQVKRYKLYSDLLSDLDNFIDECSQSYIHGLRFLVMLGRKNYSESYISSEWYYFSSFETDVLDKTAIAVGYLKSAEQLLYGLLRLHINDTHYRIQKNRTKNSELTDIYGNDKCIPFEEKYEKYFNTTFGSLNVFVNDYKDKGLFEQRFCNGWNQFVCHYLEDYCKFERNGHLHKNNIYSSVEIKKIRNRTILLYFLTIGTFSINEEKLLELGGDSAFEGVNSFAFLIVKFCKWIDPKVERCLSDDSTIILMPYMGTDTSPDAIRFAETNSFDFSEYAKESDKLHFDSDSFRCELSQYMSMKEKGLLISELIKNYIELKKLSNSDVSKHKFALLLYGHGYHIIQ